MTDALRPMSVGELLDRTFFLYRRHFVLFVALVGLPHLPLLAVQLVGVVIRAGDASLFGSAASVALIGVTMVLYLAVLAVSQGATVIAVSRIHLGTEPSFAESFASIRPRIVTLAIMMIAVGAGSFRGLILLIIPGVLLALMWSLAIPVAVLEGLGVGQSMSRSSALTKGRRSRILVIYVLFTILTYIFLSLWQFPLLIVSGVFSGLRPGALLQVGLQVGQFLTQSLVAPLLTIALSLVYYDQRVRKEAFDLEHMMAQIDRPTPA